jgi:uncharacterized protein YidB (DUF937 family)
MGLLDDLGGSLKGALGKAAAAAAPGLVAAALRKTNLGLQGVVNKLQQNGLGAQVASWLGNGSNLTITPEQLRAALGNEHVKKIAAELGLSTDEALKVLSEHLPEAVDQASPSGSLQNN